MRIEWLNEEMTRAKVIRGWRRKWYAIVEPRFNDNDPRWWRYEETKANCEHVVNDFIRGEAWKLRKLTGREGPWKPLVPIPMAKLLSR